MLEVIKASLTHKYHSLSCKEKKGSRAINIYWPVDSFFHLLFDSFKHVLCQFHNFATEKKVYEQGKYSYFIQK